jgi:dTDP-4-amino-4,6-dideoxygalactose transaminase
VLGFNAVIHVPLLDLPAQHASLREELAVALLRVLDSGRYVLGEEVERLEIEVAAYCGARFAVGCASGSDAILLALQAAGATAGDRVITTPFTFFSTASAITRLGATPVFSDIEKDTFNLDPDKLADTLRRHEGVRALLPVHLYGGSADMDPILALARDHGCRVIGDAAQAIGAEYKGRPVNTWGDVGCLSFFPTKNLGGLGDGGMLLTDDEGLAGSLRLLRIHGSRDKYRHEVVGINSRLDALQAAVLRVKLRQLDEWTACRQRNAATYQELLADAPHVVLPKPEAYQTRHVWNQFVIRHPERDRLRQHLSENGIGVEVYYPLPLHLQPCFRDLGFREGELPAAEKAAREVLALPVHPALERSQIERVCELIRSFD